MASDRKRADRQDQGLTRKRVGCVAGVLVGGSSRRMGEPKALLKLPGGQAMVEFAVGVAQTLGPHVQEAVILGSIDALPPSLSALRVLPDTVPDAGPLAGLCALLDHAGDTEPRARQSRIAAARADSAPWALLLSCDMPLLKPQVLLRLLGEARAGLDVVAYVKSDQPRTYHACCALYHPRVLRAANDELTRGKRSLQRLLAEVRIAALRPTAEEDEQLTNVNTPAEHERALQALSRAKKSGPPGRNDQTGRSCLLP